MTEIILFVLGTLFAIIGSFGVWILNSIKDEIKEIKSSMEDLNKDLREGVTGLDRRVTIVEQKVANSEYNRRESNGYA